MGNPGIRITECVFVNIYLFFYYATRIYIFVSRIFCDMSTASVAVIVSVAKMCRIVVVVMSHNETWRVE